MNAATDQDVVYTEKRLGSLLDTAAPGTYLNLNTYSKKDLKARTVLNKLIVDGELYFRPSADCITPVYFWIEHESSSYESQLKGETRIISIALRVGSLNTLYMLKDAFQHIPNED